MLPGNLELGDCRPMAYWTILNRSVIGNRLCGITDCAPITTEKTDNAVVDDDIGFLQTILTFRKVMGSWTFRLLQSASETGHPASDKVTKFGEFPSQFLHTPGLPRVFLILKLSLVKFKKETHPKSNKRSYLFFGSTVYEVDQSVT